MREHVAWFYERGWPFLLIDIEVDNDGRPQLRAWRVADKASVARKRMARSFRRVFSLPIRAIWSNRNLIRTLVRRDVLGRYSGSFGGALWAVLNPLMLMFTYFFVFGLILKSRFGNDPSRSGYAIYFLAGMLPWLAFSEAVGRAPFIMVEHRNFIKKLVFPVETLPVNLVVSGMVTEFFGIFLFALALLIVRGHVPATVLYLPALVIPQVLLTAGICWFLAALGVFVRDLAQINGYLLTIWFFITPYLLFRNQPEFPSSHSFGDSDEEPDLRPGACLSLDPARIARSRLDFARMAFRRFRRRFPVGARLVL